MGLSDIYMKLADSGLPITEYEAAYEAEIARLGLDRPIILTSEITGHEGPRTLVDRGIAHAFIGCLHNGTADSGEKLQHIRIFEPAPGHAELALSYFTHDGRKFGRKFSPLDEMHQPISVDEWARRFLAVPEASE